MINVGIIGKGYFGKKIYKTLKDKFNVVFFTARDMDITYDIDWVVIATSTNSHYELCKQFILEGVNVFVEKPMTLSYEHSKQLIELANKHNVKIYIDDVFKYTETFKQLSEDNLDYGNGLHFDWKKYGSFNDTIYNALTYHDIYIAISLGFNLDDTINFKYNRVNQKSFNIGNVHFNYDRTNHKKSKTLTVVCEWGGVTYDFKTNLNPLETMFYNVFGGSADFDENHKLTLETHKTLDRLKILKPQVAVVGAGIFGITSALKLSENLDVTLFEKNDDILQNASSINQYRLHRGYHYPRSIETALTAKEGTNTFTDVFSDCEIPSKQFYAISSMGSKISPTEYELFMEKCGLYYRVVENDLVTSNVAELYEVDERLFDPYKLYTQCSKYLSNSKVGLHLKAEFTKDMESQFDYVVNCTYSNLNQISDDCKDYQFEVCEKPVVKLPSKYKGKGIVVMDGPFTCIDPYSDTDYHVVGNVVHAIHSSCVGKYPRISDELSELINKGVIQNPPVTKFKLFKDSLKHFFGIEEVEHIGSMYTIRTVLPYREFDDARPSIVRKESDSKYLLFSGKISTSIDTANELNQYIMKQ